MLDLSGNPVGAEGGEILAEMVTFVTFTQKLELLRKRDKCHHFGQNLAAFSAHRITTQIQHFQTSGLSRGLD